MLLKIDCSIIYVVGLRMVQDVASICMLGLNAKSITLTLTLTLTGCGLPLHAWAQSEEHYTCEDFGFKRHVASLQSLYIQEERVTAELDLQDSRFQDRFIDSRSSRFNMADQCRGWYSS